MFRVQRHASPVLLLIHWSFYRPVFQKLPFDLSRYNKCGDQVSAAFNRLCDKTISQPPHDPSLGWRCPVCASIVLSFMPSLTHHTGQVQLTRKHGWHYSASNGNTILNLCVCGHWNVGCAELVLAHLKLEHHNVLIFTEEGPWAANWCLCTLLAWYWIHDGRFIAPSNSMARVSCCPLEEFPILHYPDHCRWQFTNSPISFQQTFSHFLFVTICLLILNIKHYQVAFKWQKKMKVSLQLSK